MEVNTNFSRRMWLYFRSGHGSYLVYTMAMSNFILISYRLLIEQINLFEELFPTLTLFIIVFIPIYIPLAILIGRWHFKTQLETDWIVSTRFNPPLRKVLENQKEIIARLEKIEEKKE